MQYRSNVIAAVEFGCHRDAIDEIVNRTFQAERREYNPLMCLANRDRPYVSLVLGNWNRVLGQVQPERGGIDALGHLAWLAVLVAQRHCFAYHLPSQDS